jgi:hypothetical protein
MVKIYKKQSNIHGHGIFTKKTILTNEIIGVAFYKINNTGIIDKDFKYSYIGRWVNHSINNNIDYIIKNNMIYYYAIRDISAGEEILMNYTLLPIFS